MPDWLELLLTSAVVVGVGSLTLAVVLKATVERWLSKDLEKFKIQTKATVDLDLARFKIEAQASKDAEIERLKSDLKVAEDRARTQYAGLHERRLEIIGDSYRLLHRAELAITRLVQATFSVMPDPEKARKETYLAAMDATVEFHDHLAESEIWIDEPTYEALTQVQRLFTAAVSDFGVAPDGPDGLRQKLDAWQPILTQATPLTRQVVARVRDTLGE